MRILTVFSFLLLSVNAYAQNCPNGIPSAGNPACIPPEGQAEEEFNQPSAPRARWAKTWGAIAFDRSLGKMGAVTGKRSKSEAKKAAISECRARGGGEGCKTIDIAYQNQCAVVAWGDAYSASASAGTTERASEIAMSECSRKTGDCQIYYSECSDPVLVR
ncbi:MAG: DUF4189 domain-containing protein [Oxalobacteraceae bacterium]|nr:MAG: DUF4189 domain-containing protein [Oxalobacteraceae bacterium]